MMKKGTLYSSILACLLTTLNMAAAWGQSARSFAAPSAADISRSGFSKAGLQEKFSSPTLATAGLSSITAPVILENGLMELRRDRLIGPAGSTALLAFKMVDFKAAYGAFSVLKPSQSTVISLGDGGVQSTGMLMFWQGEYFIQLVCADNGCVSHPSITALAEAVSRSIGEHTDPPPMSLYLPSAGRMVGSERYVLGPAAWTSLFHGIKPDLVGFKDAAEVVVSDYRFGAETGKLVVAGFPTIALARQYSGTLPTGLQDSDLRGASFYTKRSGALMAFVIGQLSVENSRKLLDQIEFSFSVKWIYRKDYPRASSADTVSLFGTVVASILFTGFICLGSVTSGLLLGGSRFLLRVLAPNNYFDKPERVQLLRLDLLKKL